MRSFALAATSILFAIPLAGCLDLFGGQAGDYVPKVYEFTLVVPAAASDTIDLYTLNNGQPMKVVAIGFQSPDQERVQVPNPEIRVKEGDTVIVRLINNNPLPHTIHLHGGLVPWEEDGTDYLTQPPVMTGEEHVYTFENLKAGTYFYHCHVDGAHHLDLGMYGAFIVEEREPKYSFDREYVVILDEWDNCHVHGNTDPLDPQGTEQSGEFSNRAECIGRFLQDYLAQNRVVSTVGQNVPDPVRDPACAAIDALPEDTPEARTAKQQAQTALGCVVHGHGNPPIQQRPREWWPETTPVYNPTYNTFLINGKAFPDTPVFTVLEGERVLFRFINVGEQTHVMHLHGHNMKVVKQDGYDVAPYVRDSLAISSGERYDVIVEANNPGLWMLQDHQGLKLVNDDQNPGGMMTCVAYQGFYGRDAFGFERALRCNEEAIKIFNETGQQHHGG